MIYTKFDLAKYEEIEERDERQQYRNDVLEEVAMVADLTVHRCQSRRDGFIPVAVGFDNYAEAEALSGQVGGEVVTIVRRDGDRYWQYQGIVTSAIDTDAYYENDPDILIWGGGNGSRFWRDVMAHLDEGSPETPAELIEFLREIEEVYNIIEDADDDEIVITDVSYNYRGTLPRKAMSFDDDTKHWLVGVAPKQER